MATIDTQRVPVRRSDEHKLKANAIGLLSAATLGVVFISPALGFYGNWGPVAATTGGVSPFVFIIAAIIVLPTALSYSYVARRLPSAGSAFSWAGQSVNRHVGNWLGWMMLPYYVLLIGAPAALFGLFFNALLNQMGLDVSLTAYGTFLIGIALVYAMATVLAYKGIESSVHAATFIVAFEVLVVIALSITILIKNGGHVTAKPFDPTAGTLDIHTFWIAMPLCFFSYLGMDAVSIASEETKLARSAIPRATLIAVGLISVYLVFNSWAFSFATPVDKLGDLLSSGITPVTPIADQYWGGAGAIVSITGLTAGMGATLAILVTASRILYAMARQNVMPAPLARLHRRHKSPVAAMGVVLGVGVAFDVIAGAVIGPLNAYFWSGTAVVFFALVTYVFVNLGNFLLHYRDRANGFNVIANAAIPLFGIVFSCALIFKGFLQGLWNAGWVTIGRGILLFCVVWVVVGIAYAWSVRRAAEGEEFQALDPTAAPLDLASETA